MELVFINISDFGIVSIAIIVILAVIAVANYGKDTILGYWGSVALSLIISPIIILLNITNPPPNIFLIL